MAFLLNDGKKSRKGKAQPSPKPAQPSPRPWECSWLLKASEDLLALWESVHGRCVCGMELCEVCNARKAIHQAKGRKEGR